MGFLLEPAEAEMLIHKDPRNKDVLFPYLNGEDLNSRPDQSPSRWVIQFDERSEEEARLYPNCFEIVERKVKSERIAKDAIKYPRMVNEWWKFWNNRQELAHAIVSLDRVMVIAEASKTCAFSFGRTDDVYSHMIVVFALPTNEHFAVLQSNLHHYWTWKFSSTLKGDLRYAPSDCFETFPFPACLREHSTADTSALESIGRQYYEHRQALMIDMQLGLTKTYNLFHDPGIVSGATDLAALETQLKKSGAKIGPGKPQPASRPSAIFT